MSFKHATGKTTCKRKRHKKLEEFILAEKQNVSIEFFCYNAGMASMSVMDDAYENDGCDGFNACICGIGEFEIFVGVFDEEDTDEENPGLLEEKEMKNDG